MSFSQALKALRGGSSNRFWVQGDEEFLKEKFVEIAKSRAQEVHSFYPDQKAAVAEMFGGLSLIDATRAIILYNVDKMDPDDFFEGLKDSRDLLICVPSDKVDMRSRVMSRLSSICTTVQCDRMREYNSDYPNWIQKYFKENKVDISDEASHEIYQRQGPDMFAISNELEKLLLVRTGVVTEEDVRKFVPHTARATAFNILGDLLNKDVAAALKKLATLDDPNEFLKFLGNYLEKMYRILILREQKFEAEQIADIVKIPAYLVKVKYLPRAVGLGKDWILRKMNDVNTLEVRLRQYRGPVKPLLHKFIYSFS